MYKNSDSAGPGPALMGADTLIGDNVVNGKGEDLGEIKEIMIDMQDGRVAYAVLSFGGFLGMGEKLFAAPWQALQLDTVNKRFVLDVPKERLQNAPGFNPDAWPDMSDVTWVEEINTFYGTVPGMAGSMAGGMPAGAMSGAAGRGAGSAAMGAAMGSSAGGAGSGMSGSGAGMSGSSSGASGGSSSSSGSGLGGASGTNAGSSSTSGSSGGMGSGTSGSSGRDNT
jgi:sporulation protein YlmC with PRC-barrel domain